MPLVWLNSRPAAFDPEANEDDLEEIEMAFEAVEDWCGNLDMANNFHKIDGFHVLKKVWPLIQFTYFCFL